MEENSLMQNSETSYLFTNQEIDNMLEQLNSAHEIELLDTYGQETGAAILEINDVDFEEIKDLSIIPPCNDNRKGGKRIKRLSEEDLKKQKNTRWLILSLTAILSCILLFAFVIIPNTKVADEKIQNDSILRYTDNIDGMIETEISVIQAVKDIMPGEVISTDCFREVKITAEEYNLMRAMGKCVAPYEQATFYIGTYATAYMVSGQFFMTDSVTAKNTVSTKNKYDTGYTFSFASQDVDDVAIGDTVDVTIVREVTGSKSRTSWDVYGNVSGLSVQTTWSDGHAVETIKATGVVSDRIMSDGTSEYEYTQMQERVPYGELVNRTETENRSDSPSSVKVSFNSSIGAAMKNIDLEGLTLHTAKAVGFLVH